MKLLNLQNIILPDRKICAEDRLYFRRKRFASRVAHYDELEGRLIFQKHSELAFNTYFNSFSLGKWCYYTRIKTLYLRLNFKGRFIVRVVSSALNEQKTVSSVIYVGTIAQADKNLIEIPISKIQNGSIYFKLEALEANSEFHGGEWCTLIEEEDFTRSKIAMVICTYKREEYLKKNIELLNERLFDQTDPSLKEGLYIYIVDNARTLDPRHYAGPNMRVIQNINAGGAGGFARGMLEAQADEEQYSFTHVLLMDDDVRLEPESITRTLSFLKLIKPEFAQAFIGGSMLRLDRPATVHESGALFDSGGYHPVKPNLDLKLWSNVLFNEIPERFNYFAWWYCVIPLSVITEDNLPLPIFMRLDDIEYGLRNMKQGITLNGISIWHQPFERRHSSALEYYHMRNFMIIAACGTVKIHSYRMVNVFLRKIGLALLHYDYEECTQVLNAVEDYYKGPDWLISQDPERLHARISSKVTIFKDVNKLDFELNLRQYFNSLHFLDTGFKKLIRRITFNGLVLPARGDRVVTNDVTHSRRRIGNMYRAKRVLQYDITSHLGAIFERSLPRTLFVLIRVFFSALKILFTLQHKNNEYRKKLSYLKTRHFWMNYLHLPEEGVR